MFFISMENKVFGYEISDLLSQNIVKVSAT